MPRHTIRVIVLLLALCACVSSCRSIKPDGTLKDIVEGEVFTGDAREAPPRHENDVLVDPPDTGGPVRWKIQL